MELKDKLVALRKSKGLSQIELAEALNVSRQAVSRWEVGTSIPSMEKLIALGKLYDVPLDELVSMGEVQESIVQALEKDGREEKEGEKQQDIYKEQYHIKKSIVHIGAVLMVILMVVISCIMVYLIRNQKPSEEPIPIQDLKSSIVLPEDIEEDELDGVAW